MEIFNNFKSRYDIYKSASICRCQEYLNQFLKAGLTGIPRVGPLLVRTSGRSATTSTEHTHHVSEQGTLCLHR